MIYYAYFIIGMYSYFIMTSKNMNEFITLGLSFCLFIPFLGSALKWW